MKTRFIVTAHLLLAACFPLAFAQAQSQSTEKQITVAADSLPEIIQFSAESLTKEPPLLTPKNGSPLITVTDYFWMDFNPSSNDHTIDGGWFEGSESWNCARDAWEPNGNGDPFDDTPQVGWCALHGICCEVRHDQDLSDGTSSLGAWCSCAKETGGATSDEDSYGWVSISQPFDLGGFVNTSLPGFQFNDVSCWFDYKIDARDAGGAQDFNDTRSCVYFNIYLSDGTNEWPLAYRFRSDADDAPPETHGGYAMDLWDPSYAAPHGANPDYTYNDIGISGYVTGYDAQGQALFAPLYELFNTYGNSYTIKFKLNVNLIGGWGGGSERYRFWVDDVQLGCVYQYDTPQPTIQFFTDPSDAGSIVFDGSTFTNGQSTTRANGIYPVSASPATHYAFQSWSTTAGVSVANSNAQSTSSTVTDNGSITAHFNWTNHAPNTPGTPSGPTSGSAGVLYTYSTSTSDPDGCDIYYLFDWGDGSNSGWVGASFPHSWNVAGTYYVRAKAKDHHDAESGWSSSLTVIIVGPRTIHFYVNPTSGGRIVFDGTPFDHGSTTQRSDGPYPLSALPNSGFFFLQWQTSGGITVDNLYTTPTTAHVTGNGDITAVYNRPPTVPNPPSGPPTGFIGIAYTFSAQTVDQEADHIYYKFDWGDGSASEWLGPIASGVTFQTTHSWSTASTKLVKVKAKDEHDRETSWSGTTGIIIYDFTAIPHYAVVIGEWDYPPLINSDVPECLNDALGVQARLTNTDEWPADHVRF
jgi:hypothetical protein